MRFSIRSTGVGLAVMVLAAAIPVMAAADARADLRRLIDDYWEGHLEANPRAGTSIGIRRHDARLEDNSLAGRRKDESRLTGVLERARAIDVSALPPADRLNHAALVEIVESNLLEMECGFDEWVVDPLRGPHVWLSNLPDVTIIETPRDAANFVARCTAFQDWMDRHIGGLERGLASGRVASADAIRKSIESLDALLARPLAEWPVLSPAAALRHGWSAGDRRKFERDLSAAAEKRVRPALEEYRAFLDGTLRPAARPQDKAGLAALPGGVDCYRKMIRVETSLDLAPEELHRIGLEHVAEFRADLSELGARVFGTKDVAEIQKRLRADPAMHFASAEEVEAKAQEALDRARAAIPDWFGILPQAPCQVKVMGMHEAPNSTIAYYRRPSIDGSRPGYYMINTYKPETRPRYEAEALAFHESIPGHHLQIAIAQELEGIPAFRKAQGVTAFVEGWGLYSERLADDMGLFTSDLDRIGMLSYDAWRACRLVVDTGMHTMGWSRQQAIDYMLENSVLAENNIVNEVDRYLTWPGQALAYKVGQIEILRLRDEARRRLGERFDIRGFHDAVLRNGAVSLAMLRDQVEAWIAATEAARP
jgi:uncharacterized protein (DUF885 family)